MSAAVDIDLRTLRRDLEVTVTLSVAAGEVLAVMGPSGAGKTTLLEAVAGLVPVHDGAVRIGGEVVAAPGREVAPQRRGAVLLRQDPCLFPHLSARENVAFGLRSRGVARTRARGVAGEWLERVGLTGAGDRAPRELSGGQQQRVALARALAADPRVVLLDEPFTALDPETAASLRTMLAEQLRSAGTTALFVTHDALDAAATADRLAVLEAGSVTQVGDVRDVLRAPATRFGAAIAGLNRVAGRVAGGTWRGDGLTVPSDETDRDTVALFRPADVALVGAGAGVGVSAGARVGVGRSRDGVVSWEAEVVRLEPTVAGVRVFLTEPAVGVDIAVTDAADVRPGDRVRLALAASAITWV